MMRFVGAFALTLLFAMPPAAAFAQALPLPSLRPLQTQRASLAYRSLASPLPRCVRCPSPRTYFATSRSPNTPRVGVLRQPQTWLNNPDLLTAALVLLIPTTLAELTVLVGNFAALTTRSRQLAWGIQGTGLAVLGGLVSLPWIILGLDQGTYAVPFIALHAVLLGMSVFNIVQSGQKKKKKRKIAWLPWLHTNQLGTQGGLALHGHF